MEKHELTTALIRVYDKIGRFPSKHEFSLYGLKSQNTYRSRGLKIGDTSLKEKVYYSNPVQCAFCQEPLHYSKRVNTYCSHRCSAIFNNSHRPKTMNKCLNCASPTNSRNAQYCSHTCHKERMAKERYDNFLKGDVGGLGVKSLKQCVAQRDGEICSICGIEDWRGGIIVFDLDHINGDSSDNSPRNLRLLCPNCHSQTETYKGRNHGKGRHLRRQRYKEGKSY